MSLTQLVLFAHGSCDPRWRQPFEHLAIEMAQTLGQDRVRLAYMEFVGPTLMEVAEEAGRRGVKRLKILPLFFSAGAHVAKDIPHQVAAAALCFPQLEIDVLPPVGEHPRLKGVLKEIAEEAAR
jgi:sirohydrochlorin cobaltochelatase